MQFYSVKGDLLTSRPESVLEPFPGLQNRPLMKLGRSKRLFGLFEIACSCSPGQDVVQFLSSCLSALPTAGISRRNGSIRIMWDTLGNDFRLEWGETGEGTGSPAIAVSPNSLRVRIILTLQKASATTSLGQDVIQLTNTDRLDQGRDDRRKLVLRRDGDGGLTLLELHRPASKSDRHEHVTSRVSPPPGPDHLLFGHDPLLAVLFDRPLNGSDRVQVIQEQI